MLAVYLKQKCNLIYQFVANIAEKMFKFNSYNVSKAEKKSETGKNKSSSSSSSSSTGSYSTGTLKKTTSSSSKTTSSYVSPKKKTMPSKKEIDAVNNYQPPEYSKKIYPKKTVTEWHSNKTFSAKNETKKLVIPSPKKN